MIGDVSSRVIGASSVKMRGHRQSAEKPLVATRGGVFSRHAYVERTIFILRIFRYFHRVPPRHPEFSMHMPEQTAIFLLTAVLLVPLIGDAAYAEVSRLLMARQVPDDVIARRKPWAALANLTVTPAG